MTRRFLIAAALLASTPAFARVMNAPPPPKPEATTPASAVRSQLEVYEARHGILMESFAHPLGTLGDEHDGFVRFDAILLRARGRETAKARAIRVRLLASKAGEDGTDVYIGLAEIDEVLAAIDLMTKTAAAPRPTDFDHMFYATEDGLILGFDYATSPRPFVRWKDDKQHLPADALAQIRDMLKAGREFLKAQ